MDNIKWRFPGNGFTADTGLDTADMETFKKDIMSSLARELCQNSIDARQKVNKSPVKIQIKSFTIKRNQIPEVEHIEKQIKACIETWENNKKISRQLNEMYNQIIQEDIMCLRISDFNTTGLIGVLNDVDHSPWHDLVHGSGISNKGNTSGGSKGIGKFATFVASHFNTVFYSTRTLEGEVGYQGVCKLCSAKQEGTKEKTQGLGYYGVSKMNKAIPGEFRLDPTFIRGEYEFGTDIYIIGFKNQKNWKRDIISKILDSFMSAIIFDSLIVEIDDIILSKVNLSDVVYHESLINRTNQKSIVSQYLLLTDKKHRFEDRIHIEGYGDATLYTITFDQENENLATNSCVMIRYPYMKIKELNRISAIPCSVMCIIQDNDLNQILRNIENPQHTDWEFKRIEDTAERNEVKNIYNELTSQIKELVAGHLLSNSEVRTEIEGAGEYLPGINRQSTKKTCEENRQQKIAEAPNIKKKKVKHNNVNVHASIEDQNGDGIMLDLGTTSSGNEDIIIPQGNNSSSGGSIHVGNDITSGQSADEGIVIMKKAELRGMKYRFFCINKKMQKYAVTFISDYDEEKVSFELFALDEAGSKYPVRISECHINKEVVQIENGKISFSITHGKRVTIEMTTDQEELFSGEVKIYAYR